MFFFFFVTLECTRLIIMKDNREIVRLRYFPTPSNKLELLSWIFIYWSLSLCCSWRSVVRFFVRIYKWMETRGKQNFNFSLTPGFLWLTFIMPDTRRNNVWCKKKHGGVTNELTNFSGFAFRDNYTLCIIYVYIVTHSRWKMYYATTNPALFNFSLIPHWNQWYNQR